MLRMDRAILVWAFDEAPVEYQGLSTNGGDEDWLAFVPTEASRGKYIGWLEAGPFGVSDIDQYEVEGGTVYIGSHA